MNDKKRAFYFAIIIVLVLRLSTSLTLAIAAEYLPVTECPFSFCDQQILDGMNQTWFGQHFLAPWYRWDTVHYLDKANPNYQNLGSEGTIWPPLYPLMIRIFSLIMPDMAAALFVSTASSLIAFYLLYCEVNARWDDSTAQHTVLLLAFFPTGFFLMAGYSEALFLALSLGVFASIRHKRWWMAGILGGLATLTRVVGIFLVFPLLIEGINLLRKQMEGKSIRSLLKLCVKEKQISSIIGGIVLIYLGHFIYFCISCSTTGGLMPWQLLSLHWGRYFGWPGQGVVSFFKIIFAGNFHVITANLFLDIFLLLLLLIVLYIKRKEFPSSYVVYGLILFVFFTMLVDGDYLTMTSVMRYVLVVFPAFIALALVSRNKLHYMSYLAISMMMQFIMLFYFYQWIWIA